MEDITLDTPADDGTWHADADFLNRNVRDPLWLLLNPPSMIARATHVQSLAAGGWTAMVWDQLVTDTEAADAPIFERDQTAWDFEDGTTQSWTTHTNSSAMAADSTDPRTDSYCLKWTATAAGNTDIWTAPVSAAPGDYAHAYAWVKLPSALSCYFAIDFLDDADTILYTPSAPTASVAANTWTMLHGGGGPGPAGTTRIRSRLLVGAAPASMVGRVDDATSAVYTAATKMYCRTPGYYEVTANPSASITAGYNLVVAVRKNGSTIYGADAAGESVSGQTMAPVFTSLIPMDDGDYLEVIVKHNLASAVDTGWSGGWESPRVQFRRIRGL